MMIDVDPPFGTYALPPEREAWRMKASDHKNSRIGRLMISRACKKAIAGKDGPFDIEVSNDVLARLFPQDNHCEKRAFAGVQVWDAAEREALKIALQATDEAPYIFLDVGANVGLYSLFVNAYAKSAQKAVRIIAIEPAMESCARLETNIAANQADIQIVRVAVSNAPGMGHLSGGDINRGDMKLSSRSEGGETVVIDTLPRIARMLGLTRIDAMKVDIGGHGLPALKTFFEDASPRLHPSLLIIDIGQTENQPLIELCKTQSYHVTLQTKSNAILSKDIVQ